MFKPTYLYIKTHNKTGLKYFGKTTKDPYSFSGSGTVWTNHLKKHGTDVTTEVFGYFLEKSECMKAAIEFSVQNSIVESNEWANLRLETLDGGDTSKTDNFIRWLPRLTEENKKRKWWNNGKNQVFVQAPPDTSYCRGRLPFNNAGAKIGSELQKNKLWINNGKVETMVSKDSLVPVGYTVGRLRDKAFAGGSGRHSAKGSYWWNNGILEKMSRFSPGHNWIKGRI